MSKHSELAEEIFNGLLGIEIGRLSDRMKREMAGEKLDKNQRIKDARQADIALIDQKLSGVRRAVQDNYEEGCLCRFCKRFHRLWQSIKNEE